MENIITNFVVAIVAGILLLALRPLISRLALWYSEWRKERKEAEKLAYEDAINAALNSDIERARLLAKQIDHNLLATITYVAAVLSMTCGIFTFLSVSKVAGAILILSGIYWTYDSTKQRSSMLTIENILFEAHERSKKSANGHTD